MQNTDVGCRRDRRWMQRGMGAALKLIEKMKEGDEHPPPIPFTTPTLVPHQGHMKVPSRRSGSNFHACRTESVLASFPWT